MPHNSVKLHNLDYCINMEESVKFTFRADEYIMVGSVSKVVYKRREQ